MPGRGVGVLRRRSAARSLRANVVGSGVGGKAGSGGSARNERDRTRSTLR